MRVVSRSIEAFCSKLRPFAVRTSSSLRTTDELGPNVLVNWGKLEARIFVTDVRRHAVSARGFMFGCAYHR